jgi:hypothetical protein
MVYTYIHDTHFSCGDIGGDRPMGHRVHHARIGALHAGFKCWDSTQAHVGGGPTRMGRDDRTRYPQRALSRSMNKANYAPRRCLCDTAIRIEGWG